MPAENSLAAGNSLDSATWDHFVQRLRHDCRGEGVHDHYTADAIFIVEARRITYGLDKDYSEELMVYCDDCEWFSPQDYWDDLDRDGRVRLNRAMQEHADCQFMKADEMDQWHVLGELEHHRVTGWAERWEYVNSHFTKAAAEAFIRRKKHDYPKGMRICVEAQTHCWEYNAIKEAIMDGRLVLAPAASEVAAA